MHPAAFVVLCCLCVAVTLQAFVCLYVDAWLAAQDRRRRNLLSVNMPGSTLSVCVCVGPKTVARVPRNASVWPDLLISTLSVCRLVGEQRQKNADAERLEGQAMKARMEASAAAELIQHCQSSLQAAEGRLAAKKHEINLKVHFKIQ